MVMRRNGTFVDPSLQTKPPPKGKNILRQAYCRLLILTPSKTEMIERLSSVVQVEG